MILSKEYIYSYTEDKEITAVITDISVRKITYTVQYNDKFYHQYKKYKKEFTQRFKINWYLTMKRKFNAS